MSTGFLWLIIALMVIGVAGTIVPLVPGTILTGLAAFVYAWQDGFQTIGLGMALFLVVVALTTGTADLWLPLLGARAGGASLQALLYGLLGSVIGFLLGSVVPVIGNLVGGVAGYVGGILFAEYLRYEDWSKALQAAIGGLAGWGLATAVQLGGALLITIIFLVQVF